MQFEIAAQMIETFSGHFAAVFGLGENEGSLDDCLDVKRQAARAPSASYILQQPGFPLI
jgi:hypothetical protein